MRASPALHRLDRFLGSALGAVLPGRAVRRLRTYRRWARLERNRRRLLRPASGNGRGRFLPSYLAVEGTNVCNARCVFCGYLEMRRPKATMPLDLFRRTVDEYAALGGDVVGLTPIVGDPFVDRFVLDRIDHVAADPRIRLLHVFTNAIALDAGIAERLLGYGRKVSVNVSFGGFDAATWARTMGVDRFDIVLANLRRLIARREELGSRLALSISVRAPREALAGAVFEEFLAHHRAGRLELTWITEFDTWAGTVRRETLESAGLRPRVPPKRSGVCYWLLTAPVVLADGRVNACACRDVEAELEVGDLRAERLADVFGGERLRELVRRHDRGDFPEVCRRCTLYSPVRLRWMLERSFPDEEPIPVPAPEPAPAVPARDGSADRG
jgi:hypothetical protein